MMLTLIISCGPSNKLTKKDELMMFTKAYEQGNIHFLIESLKTYPQYRGFIESSIYNYDYSKCKYEQIKKYAITSLNDTEASIYFDSLLVLKQTHIIDSLSRLNITEVGAFYKDNYLEHDYLREIMNEAYFSDVRALDYNNRKILYTAFKGTDLESKIELPYHELRDSIMTDIMAVIDPYFDSERKIILKIEEVIREEFQKYVETGVERIIIAANKKNERGLFKKIFKPDNSDFYSFKEYVNKLINSEFNSCYIENIINDKVCAFIESSNEMRSALFNQYFNDQMYQGIYLPDDVTDTTLTWIIGRDDISEIQGIKNMGTTLSVGSLALGFVPGIGAIALAADAADLIFGLSQDGRIKQAMEQLAKTIYSDSCACINEYIACVFDGLTKSQQVTENNFRKIFNDEF